MTNLIATFRRWLAGLREWSWLRRLAKGVLLSLPVLAVVYYLGGALLVHRIADDLDFASSHPTENGSQAVDMMAALIDREVNDHTWTPNKPFFWPTALLDNMPNYQTGMVSALARFSIPLVNEIGKVRGSSPEDPALRSALGKISFAPDVWVFDFRTSLWPTATSEAQYRSARRELLAYNGRVATGAALFDRRADNLVSTLEEISSDLGSSSAAVEAHLNDYAGRLFDITDDDLYYRNKGKLYAYALLLRALGQDFAAVIQERNAQAVWEELLDSLYDASELQPSMVVNGAPDSSLLPSHLASQSFYLLRARVQLREVSRVLQAQTR